jgi:predicted MPP superfamily phosphohydrolase
VRFLLFFVYLAVILGGAGTYLIRRSAAAFRLRDAVRRALYGVLVGSLLLIGSARVFEHRAPSGALAVAAQAGFAILLAATIAAVLLGVVELVARAAVLPTRLRGARLFPPAPKAGAAPAPELPRRAFLAQVAAGSALAAGGSSSFYGTIFGRHDYALEEVAVKIPGLSRALDGLTIAQLSDVHLGLFVGEPEVRAAEALVRRARPDLIVMTGDLLDHDPAEADNLGRMITRLLPLARRGVIVVPGNHDYFAGYAIFADAAARAGARVLRNEGLVLEGGLAILGLDDVWGPRIDRDCQGPRLPLALSRLPEAADLPRLLLCHNPATFPAHAGKVALQLSGHTHGGQFNPAGIRLADRVLGHPYIAGRYERDGSQIYVNRGFGTAGPPARLGSAPEVTKIVLVSG